MSKAIVAIGGGEIRTRETRAIDRRSFAFPIAASEDFLYSNREFGLTKELHAILGLFWRLAGVQTDILFLVNEQPSAQQIENKILSSDIVYVGGFGLPVGVLPR